MQWFKFITDQVSGHQSLLDGESLANALIKYSSSIDKSIYHNEKKGESTLSWGDFIEIIKNKLVEYKFSSSKVKISKKYNGYTEDIFWGEEFVVWICCTNKIRYEINIVSNSIDKAKEFVKDVKQLLSFTKENSIYAITKGEGGLDFSSVGSAGLALERDNYSEDVLNQFDHVIKDLKEKDPCGRLIILNGSPGTGKTYLTRALLKESPDAQFVILPPSMVPSIGDPDLITTFINLQENRSKNKTLVLVIEDADSCLVPRQADNMSSITSLLNVGDGILGHSLDLRIVATTNAKGGEIDRALVRSGRLCAKIQVDPLVPSHASRVFNRLTGGKSKEYSRPTILADIYKEIRNLK